MKISDDEYRVLKVLTEDGKPEWMFLTYITNKAKLPYNDCKRTLEAIQERHGINLWFKHSGDVWCIGDGEFDIAKLVVDSYEQSKETKMKKSKMLAIQSAIMGLLESSPTGLGYDTLRECARANCQCSFSDDEFVEAMKDLIDNCGVKEKLTTTYSL